VRSIGAKCEGLVEKDLFNFPVRDSVLRPVLADVSIVPIASFPLGRVKLDHIVMYIEDIYSKSSAATGEG